jgi:hypothetical protein
MLSPISDAEFWTSPFSAVPKQGPDAPDPVPGIELGGPKAVFFDRYDSAPVVAVHTMTLREATQVNFGALAVVAAVDADLGTLFVGSAAAREVLADSPPHSLDDDADIPDGFVVSPHLIDLRERLMLPWRAGRYLVSVMLRGSFSNRVMVALRRSPLHYDDPEVGKLVEQERLARGPAPIAPRERTPFPHYRKLPASPEVPDSPGIALKVDRLAVPGSRAILYGAFRVQAKGYDLVPRDPSKLGERATAVLPVALLFVGADTGGAHPMMLRVPSFDAVDPRTPANAEPVVTGYFAIDLLDTPEMPVVPQTYFVHAFLREHWAGPATVARVDGRDVSRA